MAEQIITKDLGQIMKPRYKRYALSVIEDRAIPDMNTGVKPVLKRILYSMNEMGLKANSKTKKSARVVGDVIGKYHARGDTSVYEATVRASQPWNMRYPLIFLQGNNGSRDGDPAAAMRYTEVKLTKYGEQMLKDIHKDTIDFIPNYDDTELEPNDIPSLLPNLLANGAEGIAVSMATSIPPHNLTELMNAAEVIINNTMQGKDTTIEEIMQYVKGPDFPDGGIIINNKDLKKAFSTGQGRITVRGEVEIIDIDKSHKAIKIISLPYQYKQIDFVSKTTKLIQDGKIDGIREIDDNSANGKIEIMVLLKKDVNAELVLNQLYKQTGLQTNISYNMNALLNGKPVAVNIVDYLNEYLSHSLNIILRRTNYDLQRDQKRAINIEALLTALNNIHQVTEVIQTSKDPIKDLMKLLDIKEEQANYILDTKLRSLVKQNTNKLEEEYNQLQDNIENYNKILNDETYSLEVLSKELKALKDEFGDERRTKIDTNISGEITDEDLIKDEPLVITITSDGLIKSVDEKEYSKQKRGGKGSIASKTKDDEIVTDLFSINSKDDLLFMTNIGRCHKLKGYMIPKVSRTAKGKHINNFIKLEENEDIVSVMSLSLKDDKDASVLFITALGQIKRLAVKDLGSRYSAIKALTIKEGDMLQTCLKVNEGQDVMLCTAKGQSIRFTVSTDSKKPIRAQGRSAAGVQGIKVTESDYVIGATVIEDNSNILTLTSKGLVKQSLGSSWETKYRAGKGIICHKITEKTGDLVSVLAVKEDEEIFVGTEAGKIIRLSINDIPTSGRASIGSKAINLDKGDSAFTASLAPISLDEDNIEEED